MDNFWPTGWLVWLCLPLGAVDLGCLAFIVKCLLRFA